MDPEKGAQPGRAFIDTFPEGVTYVLLYICPPHFTGHILNNESDSGMLLMDSTSF